MFRYLRLTDIILLVWDVYLEEVATNLQLVFIVKYIFFYHKQLDGEDVLLTPSLPDTYLKKSSEDDDGYEVQGLIISNVIPMRSWKLTYNGEMK